MEPTKTLWMLDIVRGKWGELIPIYAVDQTEAWIEAQRWAIRNEMPLPDTATLIHFPNGFTIFRRTIPGTLKGEIDAQSSTNPGT